MPTESIPGRAFLVAGAVLAGTGVALGAFGTHALGGRVLPARLDIWDTAVQYHLVHALALLALGLARSRWPAARGLATAGVLIGAGTGVFAGSLYLLVLTDTPFLGAITPIGGLLMIAGWARAAWSLARLDPAQGAPPSTTEAADHASVASRSTEAGGDFGTIGERSGSREDAS